jgi:hypothetical protein
MTREPAPLPQEEDNEAPGGRFFFLFMFLLVDIVLYPYAGDRGLRFRTVTSPSSFPARWARTLDHAQSAA